MGTQFYSASENTDKFKDTYKLSLIENINGGTLALFQKTGKVIQHPQCINCHPLGEQHVQSDRQTFGALDQA